MDACEPTQSPTLFLESFLEGLMRSTIRHCGICGPTAVGAGRFVPQCVEFSRTDSRTNLAPMWTTRGCSKFLTLCPQRFHPIPTVIHRCESPLPGHRLGVLSPACLALFRTKRPRATLEQTSRLPSRRRSRCPSRPPRGLYSSGPAGTVREANCAPVRLATGAQGE